VQRPNRRFVPIKTDDQLNLRALHRVRDRLVSRRTSVINQLRAFLLERGITFRQGRAYLRKQIPELRGDVEQKLSPIIRQLVDRLWQEWKALEEQIETLSKEIESIASQGPGCHRLLDVPGVRPLVATALVTAIGNGAVFAKGRDFAAWLELAPRQHSTGGKARLLGISKRGNAYLRRLFIHGARSIVMSLNRDNHAMGRWMSQLEARTHRKVLVVAVANKLTRIALAVLARGEVYRSTPAFVAS
jgi:transposase